MRILLHVCRRLTPALLLVAVVALFYWKLTISRNYSWLDSPDYAYQVLPWFQYQAGEWHAGRIPLWTPYEWAGHSLIGQAQPGAAYPLTWLLCLLPLRNGWMRQSYLHWYWVLIHYLGALFAYLLCRDLGRSRPAALLGGIAFGVGGWMGSTGWPQMLNGAVWLPLVVLLLLRVERDQSPARHAGLAGAALGMAFLSGHHQVPTFIALVAAAIWVHVLWRSRGRAWRACALFATLVVLTSALQVLPAVEYGRLAVRWVGSDNDPVTWDQPVPYAVHSRFSLGPRSIPGIVVPGIGVHASPYIGLTVFVLAAIGAAAMGRRRDVRILLAIAAGGLLFSLSVHTVFHGWLYALAPLVDKARNPSMAIVVFHCAAAVLAAFGLDALGTHDARPWRHRVSMALLVFAAFLAVVLAVLAHLGIAVNDADRVRLVPPAAVLLATLLYAAGCGDRWRRAAALALLALAVGEASRVGSAAGFRRRNDPGSLLPLLARDGEIATYLARLPGLARVEVDMADVPYNFGDWYGIDAFDTYTASLASNIFAFQGNGTARMLLGATHLVARHPSRRDQVEVFASASGLKVYLNPAALPRAWTVHEIERITAARAPFQWLRPVNDLRAKAFMLTDPPALARCAEPDRAGLTLRQSNLVVVEAEMACRGLLVVSEPCFPGWEALVDGREAPILEVYGGLRGLVLEAGRHRVEMRYRPRSVLIGAVATGLGLLVAVVLLCSRRVVTIGTPCSDS